MNLDAAFVLFVIVSAIVLHPDFFSWLRAAASAPRRLGLMVRYWRNGYSLRRSWRLAERH